jgi:CheY-like chemotaxis protein/HPt (histidine-containing phosphotransfer) domain-containing protein
VLVVEDNPVNQLVATGLLENLGCQVDLANDGQEAVERLAVDIEYDVVLMDCRMPRLDGFDATRLIREQESPGRRIPIIAMTASALEGERERCLAAGMDDYLTKPVAPAELEHALRVWTQVPAAAPTPPSAAPATGVLDLERVEMLESLVKDGTSFFERTAASFMGRVGDQVLTIRAAVEARNQYGLTTAAHHLKGSALNLGLPRVAEVASRLEALGRTEHSAGAEDLLDELTAEVAIAVSALQQATREER